MGSRDGHRTGRARSYPIFVLTALSSALVLHCSGDDNDGNGPSPGGTANAGAPGGSTDGGASGGTEGEVAGSGGTAASGGTLVGAGGAGAGGTTEDAGAPNNSTCNFPESARLGNAALSDGFCAWVWATGVSTPRGITVDEQGNVLVIARGSSQILALWDEDGDGLSSASERRVLTTQSGLNHGIAIHGDYLYASTPSTVLRFAYAADRQPLDDPEPVIDGIPAGGGHSTRTLAFDEEFLYVSVGSGSNIDADSSRARIRRFPLSSLGTDPVSFEDGEVFADGLRNEVGLRFDSRGRLWGVENGRDNLRRSDLGGDIHEDNPSEELNLFAEPGRFYGYPYCFSEFLLPEGVGRGPGTEWADPDRGGGMYTDAWCQDPANVVPPVLAMQAHSAPLDLIFYPGGSFPSSYTGDLFVSFHGSWNREEPTGYRVVHIPFGADGLPSGDPTPFLEYEGTGDIGDEWPHRPVGLAVLPSGALLVTSDASNRILAVGYAPP